MTPAQPMTSEQFQALAQLLRLRQGPHRARPGGGGGAVKQDASSRKAARQQDQRLRRALREQGQQLLERAGRVMAPRNDEGPLPRID